MRLFLVFVALAFAGCSSRGHDCEAAPGGACSQDSDCAIARCESDPCAYDCGLPDAYARSDLASQKCLVPSDTEPPAACVPSQSEIDSCGPLPGCASMPAVARCVEGACTAVEAN